MASAVWMLTVAWACIALRKNTTQPVQSPMAETARIVAGMGARIVGAFEGITQVGLGLDRARPYRVAWLADPGRLVIDVFTG